MPENTLTFLRDGLWQSFGVLIAIVTLAATIWIYVRQDRRKELTAGLIRSTRLLAVPSKLGSQVKLLFNDEEVTDVHLSIIGVKNSGDLPLVETDYHRPLTITVDPSSKLLAVSVVKENPTQLRVAHTVAGNTIEQPSTLLNPGDYYVLHILSAGGNHGIKVDARVSGVTQVQSPNTEYLGNKRVRRKLFILASVSSLVMTLLLLKKIIYIGSMPVSQSVFFWASLWGLVVATFLIPLSLWFLNSDSLRGYSKRRWIGDA